MTTETSTKRKMSVKGFLAKATKANLSASGFMSQYREYMTTGELAPLLTPIVTQVEVAKAEALEANRDTESVLKAGVDEIANAVMQHIIACDIAKAHKTIEAKPAKEAKQVRAAKVWNWFVTIMNSKGEIQTKTNSKGEQENLEKGFDLAGDADKWADRKLALDGAPDWYAVIAHAHSRAQSIVLRDDAMARFFRQGSKPVLKPQSKGSGKLSFGVKCKQDKASFSNG